MRGPQRNATTAPRALASVVAAEARNPKVAAIVENAHRRGVTTNPMAPTINTRPASAATTAPMVAIVLCIAGDNPFHQAHIS